MRTTVTLDRDVEKILKDEVHRTRQSFKSVLNHAVRKALQPARKSPQKPFVIKAQPMVLRPGLDPARLSELADDLELEAFAETTRKLALALKKK